MTIGYNKHLDASSETFPEPSVKSVYINHCIQQVQPVKHKYIYSKWLDGINPLVGHKTLDHMVQTLVRLLLISFSKKMKPLILPLNPGV